MSEIRIGLVVEGPTDEVVLGAALEAILQGHSLVTTRIQPEDLGP